MAQRSRLIASFLRHKAVYWGTPVPDGYGGRTFADPVEIDCRWQEGNATFKSSSGREEVSRAQAYVDRDLDPEGYLMLGTLDDLTSGAETPFEEVGAQEIKAVSKTWDVSGRVPLRKVWLA